MSVENGWEVVGGLLHLRVGGVTVATLTSDAMTFVGGKTLSAPSVNRGGSGAAAGTQAAKINDPSGGVTQDANARTAINSIIDALEAFGISAT
jgi:hypothetical protein